MPRAETQCSLTLQLRKDDGWSRNDFEEGGRGAFTQTIQVQVDGQRTPEYDFVVRPLGAEGDNRVSLPSDVAVYHNPNEAAFLGVVVGGSVVRFRIGSDDPFSLTPEAIELLRSIRQRVLVYDLPPLFAGGPERAYCWMGSP